MAVKIELGNKEKRLLAFVAAVFLFAFVGPNFLADFAQQYRVKQEQAKSSYERDIASIRQDLDSIEDRKEILRRYINRYQDLVERNVLTLPDPVSLVKHMKEITVERKQNATEFQFGNNLRLESDSTSYTDSSTISVLAYPLDVEMGMLHDMDIFMFMESLNDRVSSVSFPVQCSIVLENSTFEVVDRENMRGACRVNWYAIADPERNENQGAAGNAATGQG